MILATLCYIQHAGQTLMIHRIKRADDIHLGKWNGLGGKFEPGESPEECVIREVREESGLELRQPRLCGLLVFTAFKGNDWYVFVFTAREFSGEIKGERGRLPGMDPGCPAGVPAALAERPYLPALDPGREVFLGKVCVCWG